VNRFLRLNPMKDLVSDYAGPEYNLWPLEHG
jgi:hypothetical protein